MIAVSIDRTKLQEELDSVQSELEHVVADETRIDSECVKIDKEISELEGKRSILSAEGHDLKVRRGELERRIADLHGQLFASVSPEEFHSQLISLVDEYLASKSVNELVAIEESLASFKPVGGEEDVPFVTSSAVTGYSVPDGEENKRADAPDDASNNGVDADAVEKALNPPTRRSRKVKQPHQTAMTRFMTSCDTWKATKIDDEYRLYLTDRALVGRVMRDISRVMGSFTYTLHLDGVDYPFGVDTLLPVCLKTSSAITNKAEAVRTLYTFAFGNWLRARHGELSAFDMLDYLLGCTYREQDGVLIQDPVGNYGQFLYHRIEDSSGKVLRETCISSTVRSVEYVIYTDKDGNRIIVGVLATNKYETTAEITFKCYLGGMSSKYRMEKCKGIEFDEIFADAYLTLKEVEKDG